MPLPGKFNLLLYQGDSFRKEFVIEQNVDGELVPVDFTEHTMLGMVRSHSASTKIIAVFSIEFEDDGEDNARAAGRFIASLTSQQTSRLPGTAVYDIQSVDEATGEVKTWIYGRVRAIREVTRG
jgi:hypothetical protein